MFHKHQSCSNLSLSSPASGSAVTDSSSKSATSFPLLSLCICWWPGSYSEGMPLFPSSLIPSLVFSLLSPGMSLECLQMHPNQFRFSYDA